MLRVDVMADDSSVQLAMISQNFELIDALSVRWHINLGIHLEVRALKAKEIVLAVASEVGELKKLLIVDDRSYESNKFRFSNISI